MWPNGHNTGRHADGAIQWNKSRPNPDLFAH